MEVSQKSFRKWSYTRLEGDNHLDQKGTNKLDFKLKWPRK